MPFMEPLGPSETPVDRHYLMWLEKKREWWQWHNDNPKVWEYFQRFAFEAIRRGRPRISHWLILNRVRWEVWITTTTQGPDDDDFKIPNEHFAFFARYWKYSYPTHAGLMKTKRMLGEPADSPLIG